MCEAFFEWQPMKAVPAPLDARRHVPIIAGRRRTRLGSVRATAMLRCRSTKLRSVRVATDGSRWQLRSRGGAGEASAEECKGTLGCPQQCASETGVWC